MSISRRRMLWGGAAFPIAAASAEADAAVTQTVLPPRMFYVCAFNWALQEFEIVGAFSRRDEADEFLATVDSKSKGVFRWSWREVVDMMTTARIGRIADALKKLGIDDLGIS